MSTETLSKTDCALQTPQALLDGKNNTSAMQPLMPSLASGLSSNIMLSYEVLEQWCRFNMSGKPSCLNLLKNAQLKVGKAFLVIPLCKCCHANSKDFISKGLPQGKAKSILQHKQELRVMKSCRKMHLVQEQQKR